MTEDRDDEAVVDFDDAVAIGEKVVEMGDRVRKINGAAPGTVAKWILHIDGVDFEVAVKVTDQ